MSAKMVFHGMKIHKFFRVKVYRSLFLFLLYVCSKNLEAYRYSHITPMAKYLKAIELAEFKSGLEYIDCIYVINLDERPERWERMKALCDDLGIKVNRVSAINGWKLPKEIHHELIGPYFDRREYLLGGRIGCFLSHLSIFKDANERGFNVIWILEDDVEFLEDIQQIPTLIDKLSQIDSEWDTLFTDLDWRNDEGTYNLSLGTDPRPNQPIHPLSYYIKKRKLSDDLMQIRSRYGTHSILWSRNGIHKALDYFFHVYLWTSFDIDIHYIPDIREYSTTKDIVTNLRNHKESDTIPESPLNSQPNSLK